MYSHCYCQRYFWKDFANENGAEACWRRNKYEFIKLSIQITFAGYDIVSTCKTFSSLMFPQNKLECFFLTKIYGIRQLIWSVQFYYRLKSHLHLQRLFMKMHARVIMFLNPLSTLVNGTQINLVLVCIALPKVAKWHMVCTATTTVRDIFENICQWKWCWSLLEEK